ncbi:glycosyltransferase family 4 protein [Chamaesiphon sp. OTE_75_metabat_556]|uniref:glycosyltransferase family 4 protein n=1 Tax=Chamaesiphon sp. OTE_75_metabat_556 TaxID=2964692 RepID=UPI00286D2738|nr:glycosyltransferase family 4 protein [Chamaesiphon sp. OTE_75_metabat_556]
MSSVKKIAFIKYGGFSHINETIYEILTREFPSFEIETIDVFTDLVNTKDLTTIFHTLKEYGMEMLNRTLNIGNRRLYIRYFFNKLRTAIVKRLQGRDYLFTFQTQSLFDASIPGIPHFVYTDHTALANLDYPGFNKKNLPSNSWIECEHQVYHHATLNFTMSDNITNSVVKDYGCDPDRAIDVYCGSNISVSQDDIFDDSRYARKNILFVGVEWKKKGGLVLTEAFQIVLNRFPTATLTIVGCTPEIDVPNCQVLGKVPLAEVAKYFKQAAVFCLPTRLEPFGIVFLEAMAHKLPVVATNIGAIPELIIEGKNGYLVEPDNPQQLTEKLIEILDSPAQCQAFGEYAHRRFWDIYTWEKTGVRIRENIERFI